MAKAKRAREKIPRRPIDRALPEREEIWQSCLWPYSLRGVRTAQERQKARMDGYRPMISTGVSRWPPLGCGGREEGDIKNTGGRLFEARRESFLFPRTDSPFSEQAFNAREGAPPATALGDLVQQGGRPVPRPELFPSAPRGTAPKPGQGQAGPGGTPPTGAIETVGLCDDPKALGQSCLWPYTIAPITKLRKDGPEGIAWVRFSGKGKSHWPPLGCRFGPPPVTTWWILDFVRGFLGLQNPPLNLQPLGVIGGAPPIVQPANSSAPPIAPAPAEPPPPPPPVSGACTYTWRWRGVGNPHSTYGPPVFDPEGRPIRSQAEYVASPYVLIAYSPSNAQLCAIEFLRSK